MTRSTVIVRIYTPPLRGQASLPQYFIPTSFQRLKTTQCFLLQTSSLAMFFVNKKHFCGEDFQPCAIFTFHSNLLLIELISLISSTFLAAEKLYTQVLVSDTCPNMPKLFLENP